MPAAFVLLLDGTFACAANYAKQNVEISIKGDDHDRITSSMSTLTEQLRSKPKPRHPRGFIID